MKIDRDSAMLDMAWLDPVYYEELVEKGNEQLLSINMATARDVLFHWERLMRRLPPDAPIPVEKRAALEAQSRIVRRAHEFFAWLKEHRGA